MCCEVTHVVIDVVLAAVVGVHHVILVFVLNGLMVVVTDVAARGLDIPQVNYVLHYDYPSNSQIFVHRSGRTARAEKSGQTIALIGYH